MKKPSVAMMAVTGILAIGNAAQGTECLLRAGVHSIEPKSNNNPIVSVGSAPGLTLDGSCFATANWAVDVLGAVPFKHDIYLAGTRTRVATTEHLPPIVSLQYHFTPEDRADFFLGAGVNYTFFFNRRTTGPLAGSKLHLGSSLGLAAQAGVDFPLGKAWVLGFDVRWADIDTRGSVDLATSVLNLGTVQIDPFAYGLTIGRRFSF